MLSLTHTLISLPFAIYLHNPAIIFCAAFTFHLLADTIVHWNIYPHQFRRYPYELVALDVLAGLVIAWSLVGSELLTVAFIAAIAGGNMPDILHAGWEWQGKYGKQPKAAWIRFFFVWHDKIQLETYSPTTGLIAQVVGVAIVLILLFA